MFSIVIPLYNKELSVKNTIQSVLDQTCQDFEIVVINDGSTDNSARIVESIKDDRIRLIHQKNQGVSAARNRGIEEAKCEWIAFLDGDDLWEANHLEEINTMMALFPGEKVYVTSFEYSDGREMFKHPRQTPIFKIENYFKEAIKENLMWTSTVVINKGCINQEHGFNIKLTNGEDLDFWTRISKRFTIIKSSSITATYRVDAENRTSLAKNVESSHVYYLKIFKGLEKDELKYYKKNILERLYGYMRLLDFNNMLKLKKKHQYLTWFDFFSFSLSTFFKSTLRKLNFLNFGKE